MIGQVSGAYLPPALKTGRTWGFAVNLYALRSQRNWGIGDFTDLQTFVSFAKRAGAGIIGTSPLHALHYADPEAASPYAPTTRFFRNPLYLDVEAVPEFAAPTERAHALRKRVDSRGFRAMLAELRNEPYVAYTRVAGAKYAALRECYAVLHERRGPRLTAFYAFAEGAGERLETFALYNALTEWCARDGHERSWRSWPPEFHDCRGPGVRAWAAKHRRRVDYFKYLQWLAAEQLAVAAALAQKMSVGLYLDLAVGVDRNSSDVWSEPNAYIANETVGAPPDPLGPLGQNWGLAPPDPSALLRANGAGFAGLLAANMAYAGALRLDHVMALMRLFRIPQGRSATEGAYCEYPFDALLAIAGRVSHHSRCLIVGEDLGNVPDGFRERMERERILSYRVLLFERNAEGDFQLPARYPALALATATTHDIATLAGWAGARDVAIGERIGSLEASQAVLARAQRRIDVSRLLDALRAAGTLDDESFGRLHRALDERSEEPTIFERLIRASYEFLAATPARIVLVQLDDALGEIEQINVPGTCVEYPNWRRKYALDLESIASDARVTALAETVHRHVVRPEGAA